MIANRFNSHHFFARIVFLGCVWSWNIRRSTCFQHGQISVTPSSLFATIEKDSITADTITNNFGANRKRVVIVGGGVGGLAVSARLASQIKKTQHDWDITLLEKNSKEMVGGRCGSFDVDIPNYGVFRHERGPSLLLLKNEYEQLFESCLQLPSKSIDGSRPRIAEEFGLKIEQCTPAYQVIFEDGDTIDLGFPKSALDMSEDLMEKLNVLEVKSRDKMNNYESNGAEKWDAYMKATSAFLDCGLPNFIEEKLDLLSFPAFIIEALKDGGKAWPLKPHSDVLDALFSSEKMRALASFQDLYVGLEPYRNEKNLGGGVIKKTAPAVFGLLAALELHPTNKKAGVFAPIGGFRAVGTAFQKLTETCGTEIKFDSTVTQINEDGVHYIHKKDGKSEAKFLDADLVIVNADLPFAKQSLIKSEKMETNFINKDAFEETFDWDDSFDFSSGVVAFHWSIDKRLDKLNTHNVFLVASNRSQAEKSWRVVRDNPSRLDQQVKDLSLEPFNFYVHRAGKTDPSAAPDGCDSVMVLVPCPTLTRNEDYKNLPREDAIEYYKSQFDDSYISQVKDAVLERLGVLDGLEKLDGHIVHEVVDTPGTYADLYNAGAGVPFGLSHGFNQLSLTRPSAECREINNVLFVGASSRPGNGVPLVLIGAKSVAEKAMKRINELSAINIEET